MQRLDAEPDKRLVSTWRWGTWEDTHDAVLVMHPRLRPGWAFRVSCLNMLAHGRIAPLANNRAVLLLCRGSFVSGMGQPGTWGGSRAALVRESLPRWWHALLHRRCCWAGSCGWMKSSAWSTWLLHQMRCVGSAGHTLRVAPPPKDLSPTSPGASGVRRTPWSADCPVCLLQSTSPARQILLRGPHGRGCCMQKHWLQACACVR